MLEFSLYLRKKIDAATEKNIGKLVVEHFSVFKQRIMIGLREVVENFCRPFFFCIGLASFTTHSEPLQQNTMMWYRNNSNGIAVLPMKKIQCETST